MLSVANKPIGEDNVNIIKNTQSRSGHENRGGERNENRWDKWKINRFKSKYLEVIIININGLNTPNKRPLIRDYRNRFFKRPNYMLFI